MAKGQAVQGRILLALNQPEGGGLLQQAFDMANRLRSPGLIYPLAYELGQWQASQGRAREAATSYRQAQAAIEMMVQTINNEALREIFRQLAVVRAVRDGQANLS